MIQNVAIVLLFCIGAALMLQPWWYHFVQEKRQQVLLEQWNERTAAGEKAEHKAELKTEPMAEQEARNETGPEAGPPAPLPVTAGEGIHVQETPGALLSVDGYAVQAMLSIEKLRLLEPVVQGADPEALKTGIGIVEPGRLPGTVGNYVLAGHRSWTYGKQFSRLNELETGDRVVIKTPSNAFEYEVTSKYLVEPDDLSVLDQSKNKAEMTLITCEPKYHPTHRLIVKAVWKGAAGSVS